MYVGKDWTVTRSGSVVKFVRCEQWDYTYAYLMQREIKHSSFSVLGLNDRGAVNRAGRHADDRLRHTLTQSCDPVPCPECGHYQEAMVRRVRRTRLTWLWNFAVALIPLSVLVPLWVELPAAMAPVAAGILFCVSLVIILVRWWSNRHHDPNARSQEKRVALGRKLAFSPKECEQVLAQHQKYQ